MLSSHGRGHLSTTRVVPLEEWSGNNTFLPGRLYVAKLNGFREAALLYISCAQVGETETEEATIALNNTIRSGCMFSNVRHPDHSMCTSRVHHFPDVRILTEEPFNMCSAVELSFNAKMLLGMEESHLADACSELRDSQQAFFKILHERLSALSELGGMGSATWLRYLFTIAVNLDSDFGDEEIEAIVERWMGIVRTVPSHTICIPEQT